MIDQGRISLALGLYCVFQVLFWYFPCYANVFIVTGILYFVGDYRIVVKKEDRHLL